jgi:hypothetical protein
MPVVFYSALGAAEGGGWILTPASCALAKARGLYAYFFLFGLLFGDAGTHRWLGKKMPIKFL